MGVRLLGRGGARHYELLDVRLLHLDAVHPHTSFFCENGLDMQDAAVALLDQRRQCFQDLKLVLVVAAYGSVVLMIGRDNRVPLHRRLRELLRVVELVIDFGDAVV